MFVLVMTSPSHLSPEPESVIAEEQRKLRSSIWQNPRAALLLACAAAIIIFLVSVSADLVLLRDHEPARVTIELSDAIAAFVIGILCYKIFRMEQQRSEYVRQKVEVISDMNHHIRNALQVISLSTHVENSNEVAAIRQSVDRIQWALRELLPKI